MTTIDNHTAVVSRFIPFMPEKAELWFSLAESIYAESGVTKDETKYSYAVQLIDSKSLYLVREIVLNAKRFRCCAMENSTSNMHTSGA